MEVARTAPEGRNIGSWELVFIAAATMSLGALAIDIMLPALPQIASDLGGDEGNRRQLVVGIYLISSGIGCLFPGFLADRFGRRKALGGALVAYMTFALVCALAPDFNTLLVARCLQGLLSAGITVVPTAIIRDRFEGDRMAKLLSTVSIIFMLVPILAPAIGQGILEVADWRCIFVALACWSLLVLAWIYFRLPETLHPEYRQEVRPRVILSNMGRALTMRSAIGYVVAAGLTFGAVFGYVNSSQQLIGEFFDAGENFPLIFGATASTLALASLVNARIVERFGARRVSHTALLVFIAVSTLQVIAASGPDESLAVFLPLMAINLGLLGFLGSNFSSIAMQPLADIAGVASSVQTFVRMLGGALIGVVIGQAYDGSARPLAFALLSAGVLALALVMFSERGTLFRRLYPPHRPPPTGFR